MIVNTSRVTVRPEKRNEFLQTIKQLLEPIKAAKGCLAFNLYVDAVDENSSLLVSEWYSESDLNNHLRSNDFAILRGAIMVLGSRTEETRARVFRATGMELVWQINKGDQSQRRDRSLS
jgi:quinol monooxygenase YgiN